MLFGVFVGAWAAEQKGFSMAVGLIGGALLGLLSPLMFLCESRPECRHCGEFVKGDVMVCPHCHNRKPVQNKKTLFTDEELESWDKNHRLVRLRSKVKGKQ